MKNFLMPVADEREDAGTSPLRRSSYLSRPSFGVQFTRPPADLLRRADN
ncbi:hypothetical protein ACQRAJ_03565 [Collinsella sp. SGI.184]